MNSRRTALFVGMCVFVFGATADARFLQADPVGYRSDVNSYSYVANDPVNQSDPSGLYTCSGSSDQCAIVAAALAKDAQAAQSENLTAAQQNNLKQILKFYGNAGEKNGVAVNFTESSKGLAYTSTEAGTATITINTKLETYYVQKTGANGSAEFAGTFAHEGRHGIDERASGNPTTKAAEYATERNAFESQSLVAKGLGVSSMYPNLWNQSWSLPQQDTLREQGVNDQAEKATQFWCMQPGAAC